MAESSRTPVSDADLRWQYRLTGWAERGISLSMRPSSGGFTTSSAEFTA